MLLANVVPFHQRSTTFSRGSKAVLTIVVVQGPHSRMNRTPARGGFGMTNQHRDYPAYPDSSGGEGDWDSQISLEPARDPLRLRLSRCDPNLVVRLVQNAHNSQRGLAASSCVVP
jgi:hypothetical protein